MSWYEWYWLIWAVVFFVSFLVVEIPAYHVHRTLSETVWRLLGIGKSLTWRYRVLRIALIFALVWLTVHFATGGYW